MARRRFICRPVPVNLVNARVRQTLLRSMQSNRQLFLPVRYCVTQSSQVVRETWTRQGRVDANNCINQGIDSGVTFGCTAWNGRVRVRCIDTDAFIATYAPQQSGVVHQVEQVRSGV